MIEETVKQLVESGISGVEVKVESNGNSFMVSAVSDQFEGKRALPRQQMVYACINDLIKSGEVHAVTMKLQTPSERDQENKFSL